MNAIGTTLYYYATLTMAYALTIEIVVLRCAASAIGDATYGCGQTGALDKQLILIGFKVAGSNGDECLYPTFHLLEAHMRIRRTAIGDYGYIGS